MLGLDLALRLRAAGVRWQPAQGDRFVIPFRDMDEQTFVLSDLTVDVHHLPQGPVLGFNGTVEWALDSIEQSETLWLPTESQLRELLGEAFRRLERTGTGFDVVLDSGGAEVRVGGGDAEEAYARALLHLVGAGRRSAS